MSSPRGEKEKKASEAIARWLAEGKGGSEQYEVAVRFREASDAGAGAAGSLEEAIKEESDAGAVVPSDSELIQEALAMRERAIRRAFDAGAGSELIQAARAMVAQRLIEEERAIREAFDAGAVAEGKGVSEQYELSGHDEEHLMWAAVEDASRAVAAEAVSDLREVQATIKRIEEALGSG